MPRGRRSKLGRVEGIPLVAWRPTAAERTALVAAAGAERVSVNELSRRRTLAAIGLDAAQEPEPAPGEGLHVEYDEGEV